MSTIRRTTKLATNRRIADTTRLTQPGSRAVAPQKRHDEHTATEMRRGTDAPAHLCAYKQEVPYAETHFLAEEEYLNG